jgi:hypothetical protein
MIFLYPKLNVIALLIGILLYPSSFILGQNKDEVVSLYIKDLTDIWNETNTKTFTSYIIDSTLSLKSEPFKIEQKKSFNQAQQLQLRLNQLQQSINKKDVGLQATVNFQENLNSPVVDPEETVVFRRRAIAGIDWDILNNGFYENRVKNKILKLNYLALQHKQYNDHLNSFQNKQTSQILFYFNKKKIEILDTRKSLNNKQMPIVEKLWGIKHITKDNYLKAIQNSTDINAQYNLYLNYNKVNQLNNADLILSYLFWILIFNNCFKNQTLQLSIHH